MLVEESEDESSKQPAKDTESSAIITKTAFLIMLGLSLLGTLFVPKIEISLHEAHVREAWTERIL